MPLSELLGLKVFPLHSQLEQRQRLKNLDRYAQFYYSLVCSLQHIIDSNQRVTQSSLRPTSPLEVSIFLPLTMLFITRFPGQPMRTYIGMVELPEPCDEGLACLCVHLMRGEWCALS